MKSQIRTPVLILCLLAACDKPSPPPPPPPAPPASSLIEDAVEELIYEREDALDLMRHALTQFAPDQALSHFTDDFTGDVFFDDAPWTPDLDLGHVATAKRGAHPRARADLPALLRAFLARFDTLYSVTFKFDAADVMKVTFVGRKDGLTTEIFERYEAAFDAAHRIASLKRVAALLKQQKCPVFVDATRELGLWLDPDVPCRACLASYPLNDCGGLAVGDYDDDGDLDLYATRIGRPALFRNDGGRFTDATAGAGLAAKLPGAGALWVDADNDGRLDLLTTSVCQPEDNCLGCAVMLFRNLGGGRFEDVTERALGRRRGSAHSACAADIDGDGDLDIFVAQYGIQPVEDRHSKFRRNSYVQARDGMPDLLFVNKGDGTFEERAAKAGVADTGWGLACCFFEYDGDGRPDLYVVNDYGAHILYRNKGDGTFEDASARFGAQVGFGMGVSIVDADTDGRAELYVSNMYSTAGNRVLKRAGEVTGALRERLFTFARGNALLRDAGGGAYADIGTESGCANAGWAWGNAVLDYDEDGRPDLYAANGFISGRTRKDL